MDLDKLEKFVRLRDTGLLTEQEFEEQKAKILNLDAAPHTGAKLGIGTASSANEPEEDAYDVAPSRNKRPWIVLGLIAVLGLLAWGVSKDDRAGEAELIQVVVTAPANARDRPSTDGSIIVTRYDAGTELEGRWVSGSSDPETRWLEFDASRKKLYVWSGNLSSSGLDIQSKEAVSPANALTSVDTKSPPIISTTWLVGTWGPADHNPMNNPAASCETDVLIKFHRDGTYRDDGSEGRFSTNGRTIRYFNRQTVMEIGNVYDPADPFIPEAIPDMLGVVTAIDNNTFEEDGEQWRRCRES